MLQLQSAFDCQSFWSWCRSYALPLLLFVNLAFATLFGWLRPPEFTPGPADAATFAAQLSSLSCEARSDLLLRVFNGELDGSNIAAAVSPPASASPPPEDKSTMSTATMHHAITMGGRRLSSKPLADTAESKTALRAVLLFRKPSASTGQLVVVKEGLDVLRAQQSPFAIISAVGPTRTGKRCALAPSQPS